MKKLLSFILLCTLSYASAQDLKLQKRKVIDSIAIVNDSISESYSLYLPSAFEGQKRWPVVFIFDYENSGKVGVRAMAEAAEKYGYILVGSNNVVENIESNVQIYNRLSQEILRLFPINLSRIYTAGFSGGARLATSIAVLSKDINGVIACGAGFSASFTPKKNTFSFSGIVGDSDFNYLELINTTSYLKKNKFEAELYVFEGAHQWPPSFVFMKVFEGYELKKLARNNVSDEDGLVKELYAEDYNAVTSLLKARKTNRAVEALKRMQKNYQYFFETDSLGELIKTVKKDKVLRRTIVSNRRAINLEKTIRLNYLEYFKDDLDTIFMDNLGWWEEQVKSLNTYVNGADKAKQKMGIRLKGMLYTLGKETAALFNVDKKKEKVLYLHIFTTIANPKAYDSYLTIMQISTKESNYDMALYYTEELLKNGFKDRDKLYAIEGLSLLRISPEFRELVSKYLD